MIRDADSDPPAIRYVFETRAVSVDQRRSTVGVHMSGGVAVPETVDLGWFVHLGGSRESLFLCQEEPDICEGDLVRVTVQRVSRRRR